MPRASVPLIAAIAVLTGCAGRDPYQRVDVWRPTGANTANIAAMVANPRDLLRGHGTDRQLTKAQQAATDRIWLDQPKGFGTGGSGSGGSSGSGGGGSGGGSGSGGGGGTGGSGSGGGSGTGG
jgi:type IV pilus biogenesis protein CpaD/CtpE